MTNFALPRPGIAALLPKSFILLYVGNVLVVDDERSMREFLAICLKRQGHEVSVAESGTQALASLVDNDNVDVVVTDLSMPGDIDGLALLEQIRSKGHNTEVIVITAFASTETAITAMKHGAYDYLTKPFKVDEINAVIDRALEKRSLIEANHVLREQVAGSHRIGSLLGKSAAMQGVFDVIGKVHSTRTSVLITGESGTGKELVARAIHSEGDRKDYPFVAVNCGAISENLMESELFGHVKGAFTGASQDKVGLFGAAGKGTIFLDEIGELPLGLQVKLLRALQEKCVVPVGSTTEIPIEARVIAATNRDLEREVDAGTFRSDLFYRLNVIQVGLPALRQRRDDLPMLVEHFLRKFRAEQGKRIQGLTSDAMRALQRYDFPGNIRELENMMEHATTLVSSSSSDGPGGIRIDVDDLPAMRENKMRGQSDAGELAIPDTGFELDQVLADYERSIVTRALEQCDGSRKKTAKLLQISMRSLRYRLGKLGIAADNDSSDE